MPMIRETIVTTLNAEGEVHIAPLGLIAGGEGWILAPFKPSTTLDNLRANPYAVANFTDDVLDLRRLPHRQSPLADAAGNPRAWRHPRRRARPCRAEGRLHRGGRAAPALPLQACCSSRAMRRSRASTARKPR